ncbi:CAP domain-containing protein [Owenweeksia hongkongensis]|uniref:CAP domain-containing protein n=1 Tax=Owenweeksia hongkongensis TaxID=253245 RepID=UPI003A92744B
MVNILLLAFSTLFLPQVETPANEKYYDLTTEEFFALAEAQQTINPENLDKELLEAAVFFASNEARADKRKSIFSHSPILQQSSRFHSVYLLNLGTLNHLNNKDKKYKTPMMRIDAFGGNFNASAENLARLAVIDFGKDQSYLIDKRGVFLDKNNKPIPMHTYASLARKVVDGWMHSKGHRQNLMGDYNFLGCGVSSIVKITDGVPEIYFTQNFGKK